MSNAANAFETIIADLLFGNDTTDFPATYNVELINSALVTEGTPPTKVTGTGYAALTINNDKTANGFNAASGDTVTNQKSLTFGPATAADWTSAYYVGLYHPTSGALLTYSPLSGAPVNVGNGSSLTIDAGALSFTIA